VLKREENYVEELNVASTIVLTCILREAREVDTWLAQGCRAGNVSHTVFAQP